MARRPTIETGSLFGDEHTAPTPTARPARVPVPEAPAHPSVMGPMPERVFVSLPPGAKLVPPVFVPEQTVSANETEPTVPRDPPVRVVEARPDEVIVEALSDGRFLVERLRHNGTTSCGLFLTRTELEQLVARAQAALEV